MFTLEALVAGLKWLPLWILSLSIHEFAHAYSAWRLGDDTAERQGRVSLNPLVHLDPIGSILLPLIGAPFAWAKPVPFQPSRFRRGVRMSTGSAITWLAGPASNVALAVVCAVLLGLGLRVAPEVFGFDGAGFAFLVHMVQLNVSLAFFNMLPLPPLDFGNVIGTQVPYQHRDAWNTVASASPFILIALVVFGGRFLAGPMNALTRLVLLITQAIA